MSRQDQEGNTSALPYAEGWEMWGTLPASPALHTRTSKSCGHRWAKFLTCQERCVHRIFKCTGGMSASSSAARHARVIFQAGYEAVTGKISQSHMSNFLVTERTKSGLLAGKSGAALLPTKFKGLFRQGCEQGFGGFWPRLYYEALWA